MRQTLPRRLNAKEILIRQKDDEFIFPFAEGTAKLSGRDYEFRESTLRREPTVRSENFSKELHDELGESQPTETTDDIEACAVFFCRHKRSGLTIIGMSIRADICQILGKDSQSSFY